MARREQRQDEEAVRLLAYAISERPDAGTPEQNWLRAEDELRRRREAEDGDRRLLRDDGRDSAVDRYLAGIAS